MRDRAGTQVGKMMTPPPQLPKTHTEKGCGRLEAHVGDGLPLPAWQAAVAGADAVEGRQGDNARGERGQDVVGRVGTVCLIGMAEGTAPGQRVHDLEEGRGVGGGRARLGAGPCAPSSTLGILVGLGDSVPWKEGTSWLGSSMSR